MQRSKWRLACAAVICAGGLGGPVAIASSHTRSHASRAVLAGTAAPASARSHRVSSVSGSNRVSFELVLKMRHRNAAKALLRAVSTPGSPSYRHYLTRTQWMARFSPTAAQVKQARNWMRSQGFTIGRVSKDRLTIAASGTAAQVERAFGTGLANYRVMGHTVRLASSDMSVSASVSGVVAGAIGINQYVARPDSLGNPDLPSGVRNTPASGTTSPFPPPPPGFFPAPPCSNYYAQKNKTLSPPFGNGYPNPVPEVVCGYKPGQMRSAYGVTSAATGKGATVAIIDAYGSATIAKDARTYFTKNDPGNPFSKATFQQFNAFPFDQESLCDASGWLTEQAIDVEAVHAMAPDAHILYVGAQDCFDSGLFAAEQAVIDNGAADVVTNSWSSPSGDVLDDAATKTAYDSLFLLAGATGMTIQFSTGDDGDNFDLTGISAPAYPSDSPFVTGVGGTTLKIGANGQRVGELGWDTGRSFFCGANVVNLICAPSQKNTWLPASFDGASGGYTSFGSYLQPFYQRPIVPDTLSERNSPVFGPTPFRVIPDISLDGDPGTGYLIGLTQTNPDGTASYSQPRYGGTSLASPLLAGLVADADQASGGVDVGFLNPTIYRLDVVRPSAILDILPAGRQGNWRNDFASTYIPGVSGFMPSFRQLYYRGPEVYCDGTGNCASRPETLTVTRGYDGLTGLGAPGTGFIAAVAGL